MQRSYPRWVFAIGVSLAALLFAMPASACSVPVFRYALERWRSDPYHVVVFHRGPLSAETQSLIEALSPEGRAGALAANLQLHVVDLDGGVQPELLELWRSQETDTLPWMVVGYPQPQAPAWSGPLTERSVQRLLDSPIRRQIARRILSGQTGVWILLESGDPQKDDAAFAALQRQLARAEATLKLPEIDERDIRDGLVSVDPAELKISFSTVRLSRDDADEALFVAMLLGSEPDLREFDEPIAFPVFGRGRVLYALVGPGINDNTISEACATLVGPCTCQVKDQNPGIDMLMAVDWDSLVPSTIEADTALPPLAGLAGFQKQNQPAGDEPRVDDARSPLPAGQQEESARDAERPGLGSATADRQADNDQAVADAAPAARPAVGTAPVRQQAAAVKSSSAVLRNAIVVVGLSLIGIVGVSIFLVTRKNGSAA